MRWRHSKRNPQTVAPNGQRLIGFTDAYQPVFAPKAHSLTLAAAGGGKTTGGALPWLMSLAASEPRKAILITDSKEGEIAAQTAAMFAQQGRHVAVIDDMGVRPEFETALAPYRVELNPFGALDQIPAEDLIFHLETLTHALIPEPKEGDARNKYFRDWPRTMLETGLRILLKRSPSLATPGGLWALLADPEMLRGFCGIEAEEGDPALRALARSMRDMADHEHWPQHLEAAQRSLRLFSGGARLHGVGAQASTSHADLIRSGAIIYLVGPQAVMTRMGAYYALHIQAFTTALYQGAGPLRMILDEFTNAPLKPFVEALTTLRAYGGEAHIIAQSRSEIIRRFGKAEMETIEEQAIVKQWLGFSSFSEAARISKAMGEEHAVQSSLGADNRDTRLQTNLSLSRQRQKTPAELMAMPKGWQLVHIKGFGFLELRIPHQSMLAPYCHQLALNPLEGAAFPPDPKITLDVEGEA